MTLAIANLVLGVIGVVIAVDQERRGNTGTFILCLLTGCAAVGYGIGSFLNA